MYRAVDSWTRPLFVVVRETLWTLVCYEFFLYNVLDSLDVVHYKGSRLVALRFCKEVRKAIVKRWSSPRQPYPRLSPTQRNLRDKF